MLTRNQLLALQNKMGDTPAPDGTVWVCSACGKTSRKRYGGQECSRGWDESCMMNAVIVNVEEITEPADWKPYARVQRVGNA